MRIVDHSDSITPHKRDSVIPIHAATQIEQLSVDEIELVNAHGPFNHSVWRGRGVVVTHEEGLSGRVEFLSAQVRACITQVFSEKEISRLSILDVGCYDGWLLESLNDLPFARMVGIEPRPENIARGQGIRDILHLPSRVEYHRGDIESLEEVGRFDIVLCMGVLHHLESISFGIEKLSGACRQMMVIETIGLSSFHLTKRLRREIELKDIVYRHRPQICGVTAQKYESAYYPGSGKRSAVVNVPSVETLRMHLGHCGFGKMDIIADWNSYRNVLPKNERPFRAVCLMAMKEKSLCSNEKPTGEPFIADYERQMTSKLLPEQLVSALHKVVCDDQAWWRSSSSCRALALAGSLFGPRGTRKLLRRLGLLGFEDSIRREIVGSFRHCPVDKIRLEFAKLLLAQGNCQRAIAELQLITQRLNADWRACYRAFYLLWCAATQDSDHERAARFRDLCLRCNPRFPQALFDSPISIRTN